MKKNKPIDLRNRFFSFLSAMIIGLNSIPIMSFVTAEAASSASSSGSVNFPQPDGVTTAESAKLKHNDSLVDNGDGTFTFTSKITSYYSYSDYSESRMKFKDGYYKLDKPGKYLIELWGGDGGDGGSSYVSNIISVFTAGIKPDDLNYFVDKDGNTNKETGGAIVIRYIPDSVDYSYLGDVTIEGTVSSNFVVDTDKSSPSL